MTGTVPRPPGEGLRAGVEVSVAIKAQNPDMETAWRTIAWWEQTADYWHNEAQKGYRMRDALAAHPEPTPAAGLVEVRDPIERWHESKAEYTGNVQFPCLDEFIAYNVDIHFEGMSDTTFWMSVRCRETGREWHLNFGAINSRAKGYAICERVDR